MHPFVCLMRSPECVSCLINNSIFSVATLDSCSSDDCFSFRVYSLDSIFRYSFISVTFAMSAMRRFASNEWTKRTHRWSIYLLACFFPFVLLNTQGRHDVIYFYRVKLASIDGEAVTILRLWCQSCDMFWLNFPLFIIAQAIVDRCGMEFATKSKITPDEVCGLPKAKWRREWV